MHSLEIKKAAHSLKKRLENEREKETGLSQFYNQLVNIQYGIGSVSRGGIRYPRITRRGERKSRMGVD